MGSVDLATAVAALRSQSAEDPDAAGDIEFRRCCDVVLRTQTARKGMERAAAHLALTYVALEASSSLKRSYSPHWHRLYNLLQSDRDRNSGAFTAASVWFDTIRQGAFPGGIAGLTLAIVVAPILAGVTFASDGEPVVGVAAAGATAVGMLLMIGLSASMNLWVLQVSRLFRSFGLFAPIALPRSLRRQIRVAEANDRWWLALPGAWLFAAMASGALAVLSTAWSVFEFVSGDLSALIMTAISNQFPSLAQFFAERPWLTICGVLVGWAATAVGALRKTIATAWDRSWAVRRDSRTAELLQLARRVDLWNSSKSRFDELAAADAPDPALMKQITDLANILRDNIDATERRLLVAPLGRLKGSTDGEALRGNPDVANLIRSIDGTLPALGLRSRDEARPMVEKASKWPWWGKFWRATARVLRVSGPISKE